MSPPRECFKNVPSVGDLEAREGKPWPHPLPLRFHCRCKSGERNERHSYDAREAVTRLQVKNQSNHRRRGSEQPACQMYVLSDEAMASAPVWSLPVPVVRAGPGENVVWLADEWYPSTWHHPLHRFPALGPFFQALGLGLNKNRNQFFFFFLFFYKMRSS